MKNIRFLFVLSSFALLTGAARASVTEAFKQTYPLAADGVIRLENVNGDIDITAWDQAEVSVDAEKSGKTDEDLKRMEIEIDAQPARLVIKTKYVKKTFLGSTNGSVRYKLMVPAGAHLDKIDSVNSDITVSGVHGPVNLDTVNGKIVARGLTADAKLESVNGNLSAEFAAVDQVKEAKLESVNGRVEVILPKGAGAGLKARSTNGRINVDQAIKLAKSGNHSLAGEIGGGGPAISVETVNGSIAIRER